MSSIISFRLVWSCHEALCLQLCRVPPTKNEGHGLRAKCPAMVCETPGKVAGSHRARGAEFRPLRREPGIPPKGNTRVPWSSIPRAWQNVRLASSALKTNLHVSHVALVATSLDANATKFLFVSNADWTTDQSWFMDTMTSLMQHPAGNFKFMAREEKIRS